MDSRRPFRGSQARRELALTRAELRGGRFERLFRDVYVSAGVVVDLPMRAEAALLVHPTGVVGGVAAAAALGSSYGSVDAEVQLYVVSTGARSQPGLRADRGALRADEVVRAPGGLRVTTPVRTALDLARRLPLVEAVAALDALARATAVEPEAIARAALEHAGMRGIRAVDGVVDLMDARARSPMWSRVRVALVRRGLPRPVAAFRLPAPGDPMVELAWPDHCYGLRAVGAGPPTAEPDVPLGWLVERIDPASAVDGAENLAALVARGLRSAPHRAALASARRIGAI